MESIECECFQVIYWKLVNRNIKEQFIPFGLIEREQFCSSKGFKLFPKSPELRPTRHTHTYTHTCVLPFCLSERTHTADGLCLLCFQGDLSIYCRCIESKVNERNWGWEQKKDKKYCSFTWKKERSGSLLSIPFCHSIGLRLLSVSFKCIKGALSISENSFSINQRSSGETIAHNLML